GGARCRGAEDRVPRPARGARFSLHAPARGAVPARPGPGGTRRRSRPPHAALRHGGGPGDPRPRQAGAAAHGPRGAEPVPARDGARSLRPRLPAGNRARLRSARGGRRHHPRLARAVSRRHDAMTTAPLTASSQHASASAARPADGEPIVSVQGLTKAFPERRTWGEILRAPWRRARRITAVDGVSFDIRRNEFFGLLGANGAGKTT